jgi:hypothetical protein
MPEKYLLLNELNTIQFLIGAGYFIIFLLSFHSLARANRIVSPQHLTGYRMIWTAIAIGIFIILISCIFDISKNIMDNLRIMAINQGWYNNRNSFQVIFITGISAIIIMAAAINETSSSGFFSYNGHVIRWLIVLFSFNMINLISLHFIDHLMNIRILGFRTERWIEILLIIFVLISYMRHLYDSNKKGQRISYVTPARYI